MFKEKKNIVRLVLFLLAAGIAVYAFANGVSQMGHRESGYQTISYGDSHGDVLYKSGLTLLYWAEGDSAAIRELTAAVQKVYADSLYRNYMLLDARETYEGITNLATVNEQAGEKVSLTGVLAEVVKDALEKTERNEGYSMLSGVLYDEWQTLLYLDDPSAYDPSVNAEQAECLKALSAWTAPDSGLTLETEAAGDGSVTVCLRLPEDYRKMLSEMETEAPTLDLNLMHDAYLMDLVAADLRMAGYTEGVLFSQSGFSLMLRETETLQAFLRKEDKEPALETKGPAASVRFAAGERFSDGFGAYTLGTLKRHSWFDARTGDFRNKVDKAVLAGPPDAAALAWELIRLNCSEDPGQVKQPDGIRCVWTKQ